HLLVRDEVQGTQNESDFEQAFAEIVAQRAMLVGFGGFVILFGLFLNLLTLLLVLFLLARIIGEHLFYRRAPGAQNRDQVLPQFQVVILDAGSLIVRPRIIPAGSVDDGGRVSAVRGDGDDRERNGKQRGEDPYLLTGRVAPVCLF